MQMQDSNRFCVSRQVLNHTYIPKGMKRFGEILKKRKRKIIRMYRQGNVTH